MATRQRIIWSKSQEIKKKKKGGENNGEEGHLRNKHQYTQSIVNTIAYVVTGANLLTTTIHT